MKKILTVITIALLLTSLSSCRKLALHGDFSGMWQVLSIEYPDGTVVQSDHQYFYCFNRNVVMLRQYGDIYVMGNMVYHETDFTLQFPNSDPAFLAPWGITMAPGEVSDGSGREIIISFNVDERTSKRMVITSQYGVTTTLRKY